jgi:hypothetical protein
MAILLQQNQTIIALYKTLLAQQQALSERIQNTTDPDLADAISTEIYEVMHRIVLTQNLLFQADFASLQSSVKSVQTASEKLQTALGKVNKAADVVNAVSRFLTYVDKAIDLAKTAAVAIG